MTIRRREFVRPLTIIADGATLVGLMIYESRGVRLVGGEYHASGGGGPEVSGPAGYALNIRDASRVEVVGGHMTNAMRGVVVGNSQDILLTGLRLQHLRAEGVNLANVQRAEVTRCVVRDFSPVPTTCTLPGTGTTHAGGAILSAPTAGEVLRGLSRRDCERRGGVWKDGDHPDGIQMWGQNEDILIAYNDVDGDMQSIGHHGNDALDRPARVRINFNRIRSNRSWGIRLHNGNDCEVIGNDLGRTPGGTARLQISLHGSTGRFYGNVNPDARADDPTVQPLPSLPFP